MISNANFWMEIRDRANNDVFDCVGSGAPTNGTSGTGAGITGPGSSYFDLTNKKLYHNVNTKASPYWVEVGVGMVRNIRQRNTIAEVNAGATLIPAVPGLKARLVDMAMIAIGGAVGAATAVVINGVQSTSTVALASVAIAALTQNTIVYPGVANFSILAGGASFVQNDVNTAITVGKTGSNITTATHIDFNVSYVLEP